MTPADDLSDLMLVGARFAAWVAMAAAAVWYGLYLQQSCRWRFWDGPPFNRAMAGWFVESASWSLHQAYWWAVEIWDYRGHCDDPQRMAADLCGKAMAFRQAASHVTPLIYVGVAFGLALLMPPIITTVTSTTMLRARIATKAGILLLFVTGIALAKL